MIQWEQDVRAASLHRRVEISSSAASPSILIPPRVPRGRGISVTVPC